MHITSLLLLSFLAFPGALVRATLQDEEIDQAQLEALTETIKAEVADIREQAFERAVRVAVANKEELIQYARARMEKETSAEERAAAETTAKLLGTIPADMDLTAVTEHLLESQVGGFYDPEEDAFYLMSQFGGDLARVILAHELTHALDDQLYDIDGTLAGLRDNADAQFAYHAVVEGSGSAVMNAWTMRNLATLDMKQMLEAASMTSQGLEDVPPYLWKPLIALYLCGTAFLNRTDNLLMGAMKQPVLSDYHAAFSTPPVSSEQILHPEKYWDPATRDDPVVVTLGFDALDVDWDVLHQDTQGEFGWALVLEDPEEREGLSDPMAPMRASYTSDATAGWGGDRFVLLGQGAARVLHCTTVWDRADDAQEFRSGLASVAAHLRRSASALAGSLGSMDSAESGFLVLPEDSPERVDLRIWFGTSAEEAARASASIDVRIQDS